MSVHESLQRFEGGHVVKVRLGSSDEWEDAIYIGPDRLPNGGEYGGHVVLPKNDIGSNYMTVHDDGIKPKLAVEGDSVQNIIDAAIKAVGENGLIRVGRMVYSLQDSYSPGYPEKVNRMYLNVEGMGGGDITNAEELREHAMNFARFIHRMSPEHIDLMNDVVQACDSDFHDIDFGIGVEEPMKRLLAYRSANGFE